jgi:hypothetical protein
MQHSDDRSTFVVRNVVKNFVDLSWMSDRHFNGVRIFQAIQLESPNIGVCDELGPDVILGKQVLHAEELHERGVALIQPEMGPPFLK